MTSHHSDQGFSAPQGSIASRGSSGRMMNVAKSSLSPAMMSSRPRVWIARCSRSFIASTRVATIASATGTSAPTNSTAPPSRKTTMAATFVVCLTAAGFCFTVIQYDTITSATIAPRPPTKTTGASIASAISALTAPASPTRVKVRKPSSASSSGSLRQPRSVPTSAPMNSAVARSRKTSIKGAWLPRAANRGKNGFVRYYCRSASERNGSDGVCWSVSGERIDDAVAALFLQAAQPQEVELSLAVAQQAEQLFGYLAHP